MFVKYLSIGIAMALGMNQSGGVTTEDAEPAPPAAVVAQQETVTAEDPDLQTIKKYMDNVIATNHSFMSPGEVLSGEEKPLNELEEKINKARETSGKSSHTDRTTVITEGELGETDIIAYQMDDCKKVYNANDHFFNELKNGTQINDLLMENNCIWLITVTNGLNGKAYACMQKDDDSKELRPVNLIIEVEGKDYLLSNKRINEILSEMNIPNEKNIVYVKVPKGAVRTTIACIMTEDNTGYYMPVQDNCDFMYTTQGKLEQGKVYSLDEICRYFE